MWRVDRIGQEVVWYSQKSIDRIKQAVQTEIKSAEKEFSTNAYAGGIYDASRRILEVIEEVEKGK